MSTYESLPKDPIILLSFINTKLRDTYSSFDAFTEDFGIDPEELLSVMKDIDYEYDAKTNRFI